MKKGQERGKNVCFTTFSQFRCFIAEVRRGQDKNDWSSIQKAEMKYLQKVKGCTKIDKF
jgi:hypothetical protein